MTTTGLDIEFAGEWFSPDPDEPFVVGRSGGIAIDDNPYLHRTFLVFTYDRLWWLTNAGARLSATVSDLAGDGLHAWLAPGASLPIVLGSTEVRFSAGSTSYALTCHLHKPVLELTPPLTMHTGHTTLSPVTLTLNQRLLILSLAEPQLNDPRSSRSAVPPSAEAARRLGWSQTKFNRQLDSVCEKLARAGVAGVQGNLGSLASGRRARLVEYALAVRLVSGDDLPLLDVAPTEP